MVDCIVIGHNDVSFDLIARAQRKMQRTSGAYRDLEYNSVLLGDKRITYMELLNHVLEKATGRNPRLNVFQGASLAACHLTSFLRKRGLSAELVNFFNEEKELLARLLAESPSAVAITTTFYPDPTPIGEIIRFVRERCPSAKVIVGGPYILNLCGSYDTETQDYLLATMGADIYVNDSQGEQALADVLLRLRTTRELAHLADLPNLIYTADQESFHRTRRVAEDNPIDDTLVDWTLFAEHERFFSLPIYLRTSISCPFTCSFCNYSMMAGEHRVAGVEAIEAQMRSLHERGVKHIVFVDDTINVPLPRFKDILRMMIRNKFGFRWTSFFRCSNSDDVAFDLMRESGCLALFLGIESADDTILRHMNKSAHTENYREGIRKLKERGITTFASFIAGFPGETRETLMTSMRFIEETAPTFFNFQLYYYDVRTPISAQAKEFGLQGSGYAWRHATMNWQEATSWIDHMYANIRSSIPYTLHGFGSWALPYLIQRGLTVEQVKQFGAIAREMLVRSLGDVPQDFGPVEARLVELFRAPPVPAGT